MKTQTHPQLLPNVCARCYFRHEKDPQLCSGASEGLCRSGTDGRPQPGASRLFLAVPSRADPTAAGGFGPQRIKISALIVNSY